VDITNLTRGGQFCDQERKRHSARFKSQIALEAAKETKTINQIASEYELHPSQVSLWKKQRLEEGLSVFSGTAVRQQREQEALQAEFYAQTGRLKMELKWLKKRGTLTGMPSAR
jgi:transposase-like protein